MYEITKKVILRFSSKWNVPPEVLLKIYELYRDHANKYGDLVTFAKGLGIILNRYKLHRFFKTIYESKNRPQKSS